MNEYATLSELRQYMSFASQNTDDDAQLLSFLRRASRRIDSYTRRRFYPTRQTFSYDLPRQQEIRFNRDVLEVKGLSDLGGASEIDAGAYHLLCGYDYDITPYSRLVLRDDSGSTFKFTGTYQKSIHVDTVWGFREDYQNAWVDSGASLTDGLASNITLASISGSGGENAFGLSPRFSAQQLWKVGSGSQEEYMYVNAVNNTSSVSVLRGANGTVARTHAASEQIYVWEAEPEIRFGTLRLAEWAYQQKESPNTNRILTPTMGTIEIPIDWPQDVKEAVNRYRRSPIHSIK